MPYPRGGFPTRMVSECFYAIFNAVSIRLLGVAGNLRKVFCPDLTHVGRTPATRGGGGGHCSGQGLRKF